MKKLLIAALLASGLVLPALAQEGNADMTQGEVRKIDPENGKVTLRHGPIENLDMPPMTMVFKVSDTTQLKDLKPGDKVLFQAEQQGGAIVVTDIQPAQ
jgi:Cu/Ag efflux protein CusF